MTSGRPSSWNCASAPRIRWIGDDEHADERPASQADATQANNPDLLGEQSFCECSRVLGDVPLEFVYGIHRRETIQDFLTDPAYDYCYATFVLRQILRHGFHVVPAIAHTVGVDSEDYQSQASAASIRHCVRISSIYAARVGGNLALRANHNAQKVRLLAILLLSISHDFVQFETSVRPWQANAVKLSLQLLKLCGSLLHVPVSHRGSKQNLPDDPAELCYFVFPADQLDEPEGLRRQIILARSQLHEKEAVLNRMRYDWTQSRVYSKWRRRLRRLSESLLRKSWRCKSVKPNQTRQARKTRGQP